jgi:hypothetical protein
MPVVRRFPTCRVRPSRRHPRPPGPGNGFTAARPVSEQRACQTSAAPPPRRLPPNLRRARPGPGRRVARRRAQGSVALSRRGARVAERLNVVVRPGQAAGSDVDRVEAHGLHGEQPGVVHGRGDHRLAAGNDATGCPSWWMGFSQDTPEMCNRALRASVKRPAAADCSSTTSRSIAFAWSSAVGRGLEPGRFESRAVLGRSRHGYCAFQAYLG